MTIKHGARKVALRIAKQHIVSATPIPATNNVTAWCGTFQALESDTGLASIMIGSTLYRSVPRVINAWTSTPAVGTSLLVHQIGGSFIILGAMIGNPINATTLGVGG